jgi:hypothetical protein
VRDSLSSRSAVTAWTGDVWHSSVEEEVIESDLLGTQLYQQRALPFRSSLVELKNLFGGCGRVSVCRSAFGVFTPLRYPCALCLCHAPSLHRRPYGEQLGRRICWLLTAAVLPPSGGFLGRSVDSLVPGYAYVGWYPSDGYCSSVVLELLDLSRDVRRDVGA